MESKGAREEKKGQDLVQFNKLGRYKKRMKKGGLAKRKKEAGMQTSRPRVYQL